MDTRLKLLPVALHWNITLFDKALNLELLNPEKGRLAMVPQLRPSSFGLYHESFFSFTHSFFLAFLPFPIRHPFLPPLPSTLHRHSLVVHRLPPFFQQATALYK